MKNVTPVAPHFGLASLDFHLNRPVISLIQLQNTVISLIQLHIVPRPPGPPAGIVVPPLAPHLASARTAPGCIDIVSLFLSLCDMCPSVIMEL